MSADRFNEGADTRFHRLLESAPDAIVIAGPDGRIALVNAQAERMVKDEFLATLSHELRTPLNAIVGWTALLLKEPGLDGRTRHALETVLRNAHAQTQLIET